MNRTLTAIAIAAALAFAAPASADMFLYPEPGTTCEFAHIQLDDFGADVLAFTGIVTGADPDHWLHYWVFADPEHTEFLGSSSAAISNRGSVEAITYLPGPQDDLHVVYWCDLFENN